MPKTDNSIKVKGTTIHAPIHQKYAVIKPEKHTMDK
jgi:hypothetical protein